MSIVKDRRCVITGKIGGHVRETAEAELRKAGAIVQSAVGPTTDCLIIGDGVGQKKIDAAQKHNVEIIKWADAFRNSRETTTTTVLARAPLPNVRQWGPMLCKPGDLPAGGSWIYEIKWDGIRGIVTVKNGQVSIQSRSGLSDLTNRYPDVTEELALLPNGVYDGELVAMGNELGLVPEGCDPNPVARFIAFDIIEDDGAELTSLPLRQRRELLEQRIVGGCYVACSPTFGDGPQLLDFVSEHGLEGIVAKPSKSRYIEGGRSDWLKIKIRVEQEFVVVGYTPGEGARAWAFGALVLGYYDESGEIAYVGRVGTGWNTADLRMLKDKMTPLLTQTADNGAPDDYYESSRFPKDLLRDAFFLKPELVVQVAYQKLTGDGILWHPSYLRVRDDKAAADVVLET